MNKTTMILWALGPLLACGGGATDSGNGSPLDCGGKGPCAAGQVCLGDICEQLCSSDSHCNGEGEICTEQICETGVRVDAPVIVAINGDGTTDSDLDHTRNRIVQNLTVRGRNLAGVSVHLTTPTGQDHELDICQTGNEEILVSLPDGLTDGDHVLSVATQAGSCDAVLPVLQGERGETGATGATGPKGEQGEPGPAGPLLAANELVTHINTATNTLDLGREIVTEEVSDPAWGSATVNANCPSGKSVVGGGCRCSRVNSENCSISRTYPASDTRWSCHVRSESGLDLTVTAYAICINN